ncbi:MAG: sigma 54-interacting transcriptional regulator [Desulfobacterales bacterium]|nr:sigma 54-interacting transcriptional regulator [Desulfobacterales bacterium]
MNEIFRDDLDIFKKIFDNSSDLVAICSFSGDIYYANSKLYETLNYSCREISNLNFTKIIPQTHKKIILNIFNEILKKKRYSYSASFITKSERQIPVDISFSLGKFGKKNIIICNAKDLFLRKITENALRESERKLSTLISNLPGMAYRCKNERTYPVEFVSDGCYALTGYTPEQLTGDNADITWDTLIHPEDENVIWEIVQSALKENKPWNLTYRLIPKDGKEKWVWEQGVGVFSENGDILAHEGFVTDATDLKETELKLRKENRLLRSSSFHFGKIVGKSKVMLSLFEQILQAAITDSNVVLYGESGTGKELVANTIHEMSNRTGMNFVPVNCGAIPENLIESEFFGYKKGAFSGAHRDKPGYLDLSDGGTLFLDEIGDISLNFQVKLLRAIEGGGYIPVGGNQTKRPHLRIISATNKNLKNLVKKGIIREDFFYRVHVVPIHIPPLREHKEDIPLLVDLFLREYGIESNTELPEIFKKKIYNHNWPGNIRELQNVIQNYIATKKIDFTELSLLSSQGSKNSLAVPVENKTRITNIKYYEKNLIFNCLQKNGWHRGRAASELGISYRTLLRKIKRYNIYQNIL